MNTFIFKCYILLLLVLASCNGHSHESENKIKQDMKTDVIKSVKFFYSDDLWLSPPSPTYIIDDPETEKCNFNGQEITNKLFEFSGLRFYKKESKSHPVVDSAIIIEKANGIRSFIYFKYMIAGEIDFVVDGLNYKADSKIGRDLTNIARAKCGKEWGAS